MKITTKEVRKVTKILNDVISEYKEEVISKKRDWRTYEQCVARRLKAAFVELKPLVKKAVQSINKVKKEKRGAKPLLTLEQKVLTLLLKHLTCKSNREMSFMLILFSWLNGIDVSYKTIERLYSDQEVLLALHNLHVLTLKKRRVEEIDCGGDGTGYGLTVKKHYATEVQKLKDKIKVAELQNVGSNKARKKRNVFVYSFAIIDLKTRMYVAYGTSLKSEKEAFISAINMLQKLEVKIQSIRLDKYFQQYYVEYIENIFGDVKFYIIPKKNATIKGSWAWKKMLAFFVSDVKVFLKEYFRRNQCESIFAEDKRKIGWKLGQKRFDRIDTANSLTALWHNLYWLID